MHRRTTRKRPFLVFEQQRIQLKNDTETDKQKELLFGIYLHGINRIEWQWHKNHNRSLFPDKSQHKGKVSSNVNNKRSHSTFCLLACWWWFFCFFSIFQFLTARTFCCRRFSSAWCPQVGNRSFLCPQEAVSVSPREFHIWMKKKNIAIV